MRIEDFSEDDVLFNVHGHREYDKGLTEESLTSLTEDFPGKVYGVEDPGFSGDLYGKSHIPEENLVQSEERTGEFDYPGWDIDDAEYVVVAGGEIGKCHREVYDLLQQQVSDVEFVLPSQSCYGYKKTPNPDEYLLFTLDELLSSDLDRAVEGEVQDVAVFLTRYDWSNTSIWDY